MGVSWAPLHIKNSDPINKYLSKLECVLLSVTSDLGTVLYKSFRVKLLGKIGFFSTQKSKF